MFMCLTSGVQMCQSHVVNSKHLLFNKTFSVGAGQ